jgi:sigma-54 dependent transcriptional regulator, acetoin dehydrogenase operon transcriptional activator AcoR
LTTLILRELDSACADKHGRAEAPYLPDEDDSVSGLTRAGILSEGGTRDKRALTAACLELSTFSDPASVLASIPRLALLICPARGAQLLEITAAGTSAVLAARGLPFVTPPSQVSRHAGSTLNVYLTLEAYLFSVANEAAAEPVHAENQPLLAISIRGLESSRLLLVLERGPASIFWRQEIRELEIFGFLASSALSRTRSDAALQASFAVESALVGAVRDAVIALDGNGMVRALSGSAATLIGRRSKEIVGQRLRDLPGMAPLALALAAGDRGPETVKLASGEVRLRLRRYEGGLAVTLLAARGGLRDGTRQAVTRFELDDLRGESPEVARIRESARRVADSQLPILITGETGTGKEILAQAIHSTSARADEPFVGVNVSAIPRELLESELFGYDAGAFTGASAQGSAGKFELAENGTLLLDEIGDMPLEMQTKLLRVLQERAVQRLGGTRARPFCARVIASTNMDLEQAVREGRFRLDLFHRLRVVHLRLPPLRERGGDVRLLVEHHLRALSAALHRKPIHVAPVVMEALETYEWPGNVRELINVLEGEVGLLPPDQDIIDVIPESIQSSSRRPPARLSEEAITLADAEREACQRALQKTEGNVARAARMLGVAKATLYSKMRLYGIPFRGSTGATARKQN